MPPPVGNEVVVFLDEEPGAIQARDAAQVDRFLQRVEQRLLFRIEWSPLLCAGPRSISRMGAAGPTIAIRPAGGVDEIMYGLLASGVSFVKSAAADPPGSSFGTLLANVLHISEKGVAAFRLAQQNMSLLQETAWSITEVVSYSVSDIQCLSWVIFG